MGGMDKDALARTLERVSSLITDDAREGSAQPASSLSELPEIQSGASLPLVLCNTAGISQWACSIRNLKLIPNESGIVLSETT